MRPWQMNFVMLSRWIPPADVEFLIGAHPRTGHIHVMMRACCGCATRTFAPGESIADAFDSFKAKPADAIRIRDEHHAAEARRAEDLAAHLGGTVIKVDVPDHSTAMERATQDFYEFMGKFSEGQRARKR